MTVFRSCLFLSSFVQVCSTPKFELKKKLFVHFKGEGGLDYGGVAREWFFLLSQEIFAPMRGLFEYYDQSYLQQVRGYKPSSTNENTDRSIPRGSLNLTKTSNDFYTFVGRVLGLAVYHNHFIDASFVSLFYRLLAGQNITLKDIQVYDAELHQSLMWLIENENTDILDMRFSIDVGGDSNIVESIDLIPNGSEVVVTDENKLEFIDKMIGWIVNRGSNTQVQALKTAFHEFIPEILLKDLSEKEFEVLLSGEVVLEVDDWKENTVYKDCLASDDIVKWFWKVLADEGEEFKLRMLQFVTGTQRIPPEGFQALRGSDGPRKFTIQIMAEKDDRHLPTSHTCFNRLDIPRYSKFDLLKQKLLSAVGNFEGFSDE